MIVKRLILASTSPFRRGLLAQAGMPFEPAAPTCNEYEIIAENPEEIAKSRAVGKALSLGPKEPDALVLGADQVLGFQGRGLDKVGGRAEAKARLFALQGNEHLLHSAFALAIGERVVANRCVTACMKMRPLNDQDIEAYLNTNEWSGSVGCYQFENRGGSLFEPVAVDTSVIVGMPIVHLAKVLRELGVDLILNPLGPWQVNF